MSNTCPTASVAPSVPIVNRAFTRNLREFADARHATVMDEIWRGKHYHKLDNVQQAHLLPRRNGRRIHEHEAER
jgi:hypothetical protein